MTAKRILITADAIGGVWTYSVELARALRRLGTDPVLAAMGPSPSDEQFAAAGKTPVVDTGLPLDWLAGSVREVRRAGDAIAQLANDVGADVVQLHSAALACDAGFAQPVVTVQHSCVGTWWNAVRQGPLPKEFIWRRELVQCGLRASDAVVAPTSAFVGQLARIYGVSGAQTVHNGRSPLPIPQRERADFVLTVGRLWDEGKNVRTLDAAARLIDVPAEAVGPLSRPDGTSVVFDHLSTPGAASGDAIVERLAATPIFVSTAVYEPFGLSVLEAAQAGCALILSDIPTFRELWGDAAMFVAANDAQRVADAITTLLNNPELRTSFGRAAKHRSALYTPEATARGMLKIYDRLAASAPSEAAHAA